MASIYEMWRMTALGIKKSPHGKFTKKKRDEKKANKLQKIAKLSRRKNRQ